jgi:hypothetical protein
MTKITYTAAEAADRGIAPCHGYDGRGYTIGDRVELHPGTDLWMRGARYGDVVGLSLTPDDRVRVKIDRTGRTIRGSEDTFRRV